jgi:hypothetical protein
LDFVVVMKYGWNLEFQIGDGDLEMARRGRVCDFVMVLQGFHGY